MNKPFEQGEFIQTAVTMYSNTVVKTAFSYLRNTYDAEDITQEVFLTLMEKQPRFENGEHLKAWLIRVTINKCKNYLKSGWYKSKNSLPEQEMYTLPKVPKEESEVLSAVLSLDTKYRIPIHLYYYEGYTIKEIGKILNIPKATIGTRLSRGRKLLKNMIGGIEYD